VVVGSPSTVHERLQRAMPLGVYDMPKPESFPLWKRRKVQVPGLIERLGSHHPGPFPMGQETERHPDCRSN
jgi:hypothetical protein